MINELLMNKNITKYRLAKNTGIPYTTINDICSGKTRFEKCSADTVYRIAKELGVSMESLIEPYMEKRVDFELFKSDICHRLKELGDIDFIIELLEKNLIYTNYKRKWYAESLYLLTMLDYLSNENNIELCTRYDDLRCVRLDSNSHQSSVVIAPKDTNQSNVNDILETLRNMKQQRP